MSAFTGAAQATTAAARADLTAALNKIAAAGQAHTAAQAQYQTLIHAMTGLQPSWAPLPLAPYPPGNDTTGFPKTGDASLVVGTASVTRAQQGEPARVAQGLSDQAAARTPSVKPMFWVGLALLGVGIYVLKKH